MHNQFKTQKFKHLMLAMGPRDLNSAPCSPVHCSSHSMTSFRSSELTELPAVENSQLFAQRTVRPPTICKMWLLKSLSLNYLLFIHWCFNAGSLRALWAPNVWTQILWWRATSLPGCICSGVVGFLHSANTEQWTLTIIQHSMQHKNFMASFNNALCHLLLSKCTSILQFNGFNSLQVQDKQQRKCIYW